MNKKFAKEAKENVSERVKTTKKEIEQLKNELESLINMGTSIQPIVMDKKVSEIEKLVRSKSPDVQSKIKPPKSQQKSEPSKTGAVKRIKNYNTTEAREFIKKQREQRADDLKARIKVSDNQVALKKEKLQELHRKALDLVNKNVQMKRERSNSRPREPQVRLDKSSLRYKSAEDIHSGRPKAQSKKDCMCKARSASQNRLNVPHNTNQRVKSREVKVENKVVMKECTKSLEGAKSNLTRSTNERQSRSRTKPKQLEAVTSSSQHVNTNYLFPPAIEVRPDFDKTVIPSLVSEKKVDEPQKVKKVKNALEFAVMTDACLKDTKETQTSTCNNIFHHFESPVVIPYPYNFINTVKKKLQHAIKSPISFINADGGTKTPEISAQSKEEIKEKLIQSAKSDLKSFASHKKPNLDLKLIENMELVPKKHSKSKADTISKNLFVGYNSDSDTSKNIPDISSESLGSAHSKPVLSLSKLNDLRLKQTSKSPRDMNSEANDYSELHSNSYSSDFQSAKTSLKSEKSASSIHTVVSEKQSVPMSTDFKQTFKEPSGTFTVTTDQKKNSSSDMSRMMKTITLREKKSRSLGSGDDNSQQTYKSLLTEEESPISTSESTNDLIKRTISKCISNREIASLNLKQPSVSLLDERLKRGDILKSQNVTVKSAGSSNISTTDNESSRSTTELISEDLTDRIASKNVSNKGNSPLSLKEPSLSLLATKRKPESVYKTQMKNLTVRSRAPANNVSEIHLKFEAEVRLLNDFNESFEQFKAAEKAFENLKNKNDTNVSITKKLQNVDTQTSVVTKSSSMVSTEKKESTINYSRGSELLQERDTSVLSCSRDTLNTLQNFSFSTDWNLSKFNESSITNISMDEDRSQISIANIENYDINNSKMVSLNLLDHLIKDEETKIQQLKTFIKIRQQALLDRTRAKLGWLEIQRKQLIETGKIQEASQLKKKQRGIVIKLEEECNEIKKLKQKEKEVSKHRKNTLKKHRNIIKTQLSSENMLASPLPKRRAERRSVGPLRVVQSCSESIHSETSTSVKSSIVDILNTSSVKNSEGSELNVSNVSIAKRSLLMREAALQERRKTVEELLRWHRKLLDEERKVSELEATAISVVKQTSDGSKKLKFNGKQLKQLWKNMTGSDNSLVEEPEKTNQKKTKNEQSNSVKKSSEDVSYSSGFEPESVHEINNSQGEKTQISSISELIDNFSRIEGEISTFSRKPEGITPLQEDGQSMTPEVVTLEQENPERTTTETSNIKSLEDESVILPEPLEFEQMPKDEVGEKTEPQISSTIEIEDSDEETPVLKNLVEDKSVISTSDQKTIDAVSDKVIETAPTEETEDEEIKSETIVGSKEDVDEQSSVKSTKVSVLKEDAENEDVTTDRTFTKPEDSDRLNIENSLTEVSTNEKQSLDPTVEPLEVEQMPKYEVSEKTKLQISSTIEIKDPDEETPVLKDKSAISTSDEKTIDEVSDKEIETAPAEEIEDEEVKSETVFGSKEDVDEQFSVKVCVLNEDAENEEVTTDRTFTKPEDSDGLNNEKSLTEVSTSEKQSLDPTVETTGEIDQPESTSLHIDDLEEALESASKIEESLTKLNEQLSGRTEEFKNLNTEKVDIENSTSPGVSVAERKTPSKKEIDVKKRVSEILADASPSRGDKSPRLQDLYVTAYDVGGTSNSPEIPEEGRQLPTDIFGSEAEELWRKQLAIEQEIKQIELQQKEQLPYVFMREIPNKPPPPYTPKSPQSSLPQTILPTDVKEVNEIASYSSKVLYKAYQNKNLDKVKFSENGFKLFSKLDVTKGCAEFAFNICRDIVKDHYKQFEEIEEPSWLTLPKAPHLKRIKPADASGLEKILSQKLKELFGFKKVQTCESAIIKWGRKKRDHVDEVLVRESQEEESQWTNFDKNELIVKNRVTEDIMKILLEETANTFAKILSNKKSVVG